MCCWLRITLKITQQCVFAALSSTSQHASLEIKLEPKPDSFTELAFIVCSFVYSSSAYKNPEATLGQKTETGQETVGIPASLQLSAPSKVMKN